MLGKLMKYEMKSMGRILLPLYAALVVAAAVFALNMKLSMNRGVASILERFALLTMVLFMLLVAAVFIVTLLLILQRFYRNMLGNEGYLVFSLPAHTAEQITSKALSAMLWVLAGVIAGCVAGLTAVSILSSVPDFLNQLKAMWEMLLSSEQTAVIARQLLLMLLVIALGILESILKVYAAMSAGHQWNGHKILGSVLAYVAFSIIESVLSMLFLRVTGLSSSRSMLYISSAGTVTAQGVFGPAIAVSIIGIIAYGWITWYYLDRRLNLE